MRGNRRDGLCNMLRTHDTVKLTQHYPECWKSHEPRLRGRTESRASDGHMSPVRQGSASPNRLLPKPFADGERRNSMSSHDDKDKHQALKGLIAAESPSSMTRLDGSISVEHQRMIDDADAVAAAADAAAYGGTGRDVPAALRIRLQHSNSQQQRHHSSTSPSRGHSPNGNRHHSHHHHHRHHREHQPGEDRQVVHRAEAGKEAHGASIRHTTAQKLKMVMTAVLPSQCHVA